MKRRIIITPQAFRQISSARRWWRANHEKAPTAFDDDLDAALDDIAAAPTAGAPAGASRRGTQRWLIARIGYNLYYRVIDDVVYVTTFWHTSRRPPKL
jgi:plasmid stabilization system protein ParE